LVADSGGSWQLFARNPRILNPAIPPHAGPLPRENLRQSIRESTVHQFHGRILSEKTQLSFGSGQRFIADAAFFGWQGGFGDLRFAIIRFGFVLLTFDAAFGETDHGINES
jgi:hypothetical protein